MKVNVPVTPKGMVDALMSAPLFSLSINGSHNFLNINQIRSLLFICSPSLPQPPWLLPIRLTCFHFWQSFINLFWELPQEYRNLLNLYNRLISTNNYSLILLEIHIFFSPLPSHKPEEKVKYLICFVKFVNDKFWLTDWKIRSTVLGCIQFQKVINYMPSCQRNFAWKKRSC